MREVCRDCKYSKQKNRDYCYCVKYGCPIRYGRAYCISWERSEKVEQIQCEENGSGWNDVRFTEGGEPL